MRRSSVVLCAVAAVVAIAANGCSSSDSAPVSSASGTGTDIAANVESTLDGEYATTSAGPLEDITFYDGTGYVTWPSSCAAADAGSSCLDIGTYAVSSDGSQLALTSGVTGSATSLPYQALTATTADSSAAPNAFHLDGLVNADAGALVKSTVKTATIGSQGVTLVVPVAALVSSSSSNCVMSLPVSGDPSSFLAAAHKALATKGGSISGSTTAGSFTVPGPLHVVTGT